MTRHLPVVGMILGAVALVFLSILPMDSSAQGLVAIALIGLLLAATALAHKEDRLLPRVIFAMLGVAISLRYLLWRVAHTLDGSDIIGLLLAYMLFFAEVYYFALQLIGLFVNIVPYNRPVLTLADVDSSVALPSIDILVPSYNEEATLLEVTLRAARQVEYRGQKEVYLLDDGGTDQRIHDPDPAKAAAARKRRTELKQLCRKLGCHYLTRPKNESAKAGNINHALGQTTGELIVILDADHVPTHDFLDRTVPWMIRDPDVFLVQTPHFMINSDPIDRNLLRSFRNMPSENDMFYKTTLRGLDFWSSAFFCGSAALLRREKLEAVGGLSGETITEDAEAALDMHARGWKSVYVDQPLIAGLAPETFADFVVQRMRWAQGMVQILILKRPYAQNGLRWYQRLGYMNAILFWFFPFFRLIFLFAPLPYLLLGLEVYRASLPEILAYAVPHLVATLVIGHALFSRTRWSLVSEVYETVQSVFLAQALLKVFMRPRAPSFVVTPKGETLDDFSISPLAGPFYLLCLLMFMGIFGGAWHLMENPLSRGTTSVIMLWNLLNLIIVLAALAIVVERPQRRTVPRIYTREKGFLLCEDETYEEIQVTDVSGSGLGFELSNITKLPSHSQNCDVVVYCQALKREILLPVEIKTVAGTKVGAAFQITDSRTFDLVVAYVYGDSGRWRYFEERRLRPIPVRKSLRIFFGALSEPLRDHIRYLSRDIAQRMVRRSSRLWNKEMPN